jgi:flagellar basal-body rod protein FlgC
MEMDKALTISAFGMQAQTTRLRVIAENLANQDTTGTMDRSVGSDLVRVKKISEDQSALPLRYDPGHPAADAQGYVQTPNVNSFVEVMDMREAERSYSANLSVMQATRSMLSQTIDMLK